MPSLLRAGRAVVAAALASATLSATEARAAQPNDDGGCARASTAMFEIAPWAAIGSGVRATDGAQRAIGHLAMHAAVTGPVSRRWRIGAWAAPGTTDFASFDLAGGGRIEWHSNDTDDVEVKLFGVGMRFTLLVDLGAGQRLGRNGNEGGFYAARIAFGFTARNRLGFYGDAPCRCPGEEVPDGPRACRATSGLVSGVRPFVSVHRSVDGVRTEATAGLEFELIGAGWWIGQLL